MIAYLIRMSARSRLESCVGDLNIGREHVHTMLCQTNTRSIGTFPPKSTHTRTQHKKTLCAYNNPISRSCAIFEMIAPLARTDLNPVQVRVCVRLLRDHPSTPSTCDSFPIDRRKRTLRNLNKYNVQDVRFPRKASVV